MQSKKLITHNCIDLQQNNKIAKKKIDFVVQMKKVFKRKRGFLQFEVEKSCKSLI